MSKGARLRACRRPYGYFLLSYSFSARDARRVVRSGERGGGRGGAQEPRQPTGAGSLAPPESAVGIRRPPPISAASAKAFSSGRHPASGGESHGCFIYDVSPPGLGRSYQLHQ